MIKLTNYRLIFIPFQKGFVKYKDIEIGRKIFRFNITQHQILDTTDNENILHQNYYHIIITKNINHPNQNQIKTESNQIKSETSIFGIIHQTFRYKSAIAIAINGKYQYIVVMVIVCHQTWVLTSSISIEIKQNNKFLYKYQLEISDEELSFYFQILNR